MKCDWEEVERKRTNEVKTKKGSDEKRPFLKKRTAESQLRSARQNGKTRNDDRRYVLAFWMRKGCFSFSLDSFPQK